MLKVLSSVRPRSLVIAAALINTATELRLTKDMVITCGANGQHMVGSKHAAGDALDIRTKHLTPQELAALVAALQQRLGPDYDLVMEDVGKTNEHLHCERDPA